MCLFLLLVLFLSAEVSFAVSPPNRTEDSITYWKPFEVLPDEDPMVSEAHRIFKRLLSAWEEARIAPSLHVVHSDAGPWAASLDDGSILLSREAIDLCFQIDSKGQHDRLAFVLAHELAHQRADHLWHRRFFRLASQQPPQVRGRMLSDMPVDQLEVDDLEAKETQADREGLLLMTMTGFDPYSVAGAKSHFFEKWVESIWGDPCGLQAKSAACTKAVDRAVRVQTYLREMAKQTVLFDIGLQAYVIGNYPVARTFLTRFGREFPRHEVHNNIGLTYVGEAMDIREKLLSMGENLGLGFMFRYVLTEEAGIPKEKTQRGGTRGGSPKPEVVHLQHEISKQLNEACLAFERAMKLDPAYREAYWNLASTYLVMGNAPAAYGVIAGKYVPQFGEDAMSSMLLGISAYLEGQEEKARTLLEKAVEKGGVELSPFTRANLAVYLDNIGDKEGARAQWKALADLGKNRGDEGLFLFALRQLGKQVDSPVPSQSDIKETVHGYAFGQKVSVTPRDAQNQLSDEIWVEGERIQIYQFSDGAKIVVDSNQRVIALWQGEGDAITARGIRIGDDASKIDRVYQSARKKVTTNRGEYRILKDYRIAFHIIRGKVAGWFLFEPMEGKMG